MGIQLIQRLFYQLCFYLKQEQVSTISVDPNVFKVSSSFDLNLKVNVIIIFNNINSVSIVNLDSIPSLDESDKPDIVLSFFPNTVPSYDCTQF